MIKQLISIFLLCYALFTSSIAYSAESDVSNLEDEILLLENKLAKLKNELKSKTDTKAADKLVPGPILDVWTIESGNLTEIPNTLSLGRLVDTSELFNYGVIRKDNYLKSYYKKPVGMLWTGMLNITESADYMILHEVNIKKTPNGAGWNYNIYSSLQLENELIIEQKLNRINGGSKSVSPKSITMALQKGKYKIKLWLAANWMKSGGMFPNYDLEPKNITVNIKLRNSSMRTPENVSKQNLFHIE